MMTSDQEPLVDKSLDEMLNEHFAGKIANIQVYSLYTSCRKRFMGRGKTRFYTENLIKTLQKYRKCLINKK